MGQGPKGYGLCYRICDRCLSPMTVDEATAGVLCVACLDDEEPEPHGPVLCGCGWGLLACDLPALEELEVSGCPVCGRPFSVRLGWSLR